MTFSLQRYLDELAPLVNVDCGTFQREGIEVIAALMADKYEQMTGWHIKRVECGEAGIGLEIRNQPTNRHIDVLLIGHMDTVFPKGTAAERPMHVEEGFAHGPGVSDMKSGLLNIVYALRALPMDDRDKLSICVCMNPDEEVGSIHSSAWLETVARQARYVLVAEAARADGGLVKARKGMARYKIAISGRAAHAGNEPEKGRSAVTELAHWLVTLDSMKDIEAGTSINAGVIEGGTGANIVAESASALIDVRFWDNNAYHAIDQAIRGRALHPYTPDVTVKLAREAYKPAMVPSIETEHLMNLVETAAFDEKVPIHWKAVGGGSDANNTAALGIPSLDGFGPVGANFHSDEEYLQLDSIEPRIRLLTRVFSLLANQKTV
ncbi:M20 family metallopeptidase [Salinivibrio sp. ES.052]|uniref:M20 family metallopeptidase n=1 Tax=Salinivibrio sp. ES.052 TaxID=1882823 RepID=UPI00092676B0|nr:M20 family metallopeptidase [Salinivibrio sp. ES.052]SIO36289.1 glutamate carboxypeptidase [Salinivibrio sp. ES.052]